MFNRLNDILRAFQKACQTLEKRSENLASRATALDAHLEATLGRIGENIKKTAAILADDKPALR